ncbi:four-carbon acid sugar kinase family protein, partial [Saccharomonospora saliphila]|uniref:four-carbon acid sugar kinase family protein n=1 Tax=Saccharomonospora saliphila TaxID=369829 RepID=UPI00035F7878
MRDTTTSQVLALADDLSGAAETAAALGAPARSARIALVREGAPSAARSAQSILVLDLDSRTLPGATAERVTRAALQRHADPESRVFLKIDSLLRGTVAATVRGAAGAPVVLAPALPSGGRTVLGGVVHVRGVPLHETEAWRAETRRPPSTVASLLDPVPTETVDLATVRSDDLAARLAAGLRAGRVPVCDGETD